MATLLNNHKNLINKINYDVFLSNYDAIQKLLNESKKLLDEEKKLTTHLFTKK